MTSVVGMRWISALVCAVACTMPGFAANEQDDKALRAIEQELARLRAENEAMREEIDELRLLTDDNWMTEQRAEEIRALVHDVLADADTRSSLQSTGLTAGWSDHFFLASPDGSFKLRVDGKIQFRYLFNLRDETPDESRAGFENTRTQLTLSGHIFDRDWEYLVRGAFGRGITPNDGSTAPDPNGGDFRLLDAWVRYYLSDNWSLRFGQYKVPFSRERLVDSAYLQGAERSNVDIHLALGRTQGIELTYIDDGQRFSATLHDGGEDFLFGETPVIFDARAPNSSALTRDSEIAFAARYEVLLAGTWGQFVDFTSRPDEDFALMWGVAGPARIQEFEGDPPAFVRDEFNWYGSTTDLSVEWGGANGFVSFTHHYLDIPGQRINIIAVVAQVGVYFTPKLEGFLRYEHGEWFDPGAGRNDLDLLTFGANYYIDGHDLKWVNEFVIGLAAVDPVWESDTAGIRRETANNAPQVVFRTQFQLLF